MSVLIIGIVMGVVLTVAACAMGKPLPRPTTYSADPPMPETRPAAAGRAQPAVYVLKLRSSSSTVMFAGGRRPPAILAVQFALIDQSGVRPQLIYERTIASRVELPHALPDALVRRYGEALAEILSQLIPDLGAVIPHDHGAASVRSQPRRSSNSSENYEQCSPE
jgi:hypothetical protein